MSIQKVREYFKQFGIEDRIREFDVSSATVELAAVAVGVEGARIAKSLSFKLEDRNAKLPDGQGEIVVNTDQTGENPDAQDGSGDADGSGADAEGQDGSETAGGDIGRQALELRH